MKFDDSEKTKDLFDIAEDDVPSPIPFAILFSIFPILKTIGAIIEPTIPVKIMHIMVIDSIPFKEFTKETPIGVVIDFGIIEFNIISSAFIILHIIKTLKKEINTPVIIPTKIATICFFNKSNCL